MTPEVFLFEIGIINAGAVGYWIGDLLKVKPKIDYMAKKKHFPATSLAAYKSLPHEMVNNHHRKIVECLKVLGKATAEEIGIYIGMLPHKIGKRMSELEKLKVVEKPGTTKKTKSGREAFEYCLCNQPRTDNEVKAGKPKKERTSKLITISNALTLF